MAAHQKSHSNADTIHLGDLASATNVRLLEKIASTLDFDEVLRRVIEYAVQLSRADEGSLLLLDKHTGELYIRAAKGLGEEYVRTFRQKVSDDNVAGRVILTGRPVLIGPESGLSEQIKIKTGYLAESVLSLPINHESITHGVLSVYIKGNRRTFTRRHLSLLEPLAKNAAIAIENARRYQETNQLLGDAYTLFEIAELFTETHELDELLHLIASLTLGRIEPADRVVIHLLDPLTKRLERNVRIPPDENASDHPRGFAIGQGIAGRVLQENRPANISDVKNDERFEMRGISSGSLLVAPISKRSTCIGTISVASPEKTAFKARDERFLTSLANLAAVAIENARLYDQQAQLLRERQERLEIVERRNRELNSLREVLGALQSTLSLPEVLGHITNGVVSGLNYRAVMLSTIDEVNKLLVVKEFALQHKLAIQGLVEKSEQLTGQKLVGNRASLEQDLGNIGIQVCLERRARVTYSLYDIFIPVVGQKMCAIIQKMFRLSTFAVLPIKSEEHLFGVLYAGTGREQILDEDLEALQAFANQAALAIQNARQFEHIHERLRRRVRELQSVQDIDRLISSTANLEMMLRNILDMGLKLVGAEYGNIVLANPETGALVPKVSYPAGAVSIEAYEPGLTAWVAQERETARIADLSQTPWGDTRRNPEVRSELAAPILLGEELVGVINMGSPRINAFTEEDESLLDILATQTAVAIQTAQYYQELEEVRTRSAEAERIAAMSDMATNMVHNINNSVGAIRVLVQQIRQKVCSDTLTTAYLEERLAGIETSADKTLEMARNIRNPFRTQPTELVDINKCIRDTLSSLAPLLTNIELLLHLEENLAPVTATHQFRGIPTHQTRFVLGQCLMIRARVVMFHRIILKYIRWMLDRIR